MFKKGDVNNPFGRPKMPPEFRKAALEKSSTALEVLEQVMLDRRAPAAARVAAANSILDRAFGKPEQAITTEVSHPLAGLSFRERRAILMEKMGIVTVTPETMPAAKESTQSLALGAGHDGEAIAPDVEKEHEPLQFPPLPSTQAKTADFPPIQTKPIINDLRERNPLD